MLIHNRGGDAIQLVGTNDIWIDHNKFSLIGRQMIVTGYDAAGKVTISNNEFDGVTSWSASCNGEHYWTMLFLGDQDYITLSNNYVHDVSGRAPKVGGSGSITMHAVNNYFENIGGHDFDVAEGGNVLIEGNVFKSSKQPITAASASDGGSLFNVPSTSSASTCTSYLGRACVANELTDSGDFGSYTSTNPLSALKAAGGAIDAVDVSTVAKSVLASAGVGKVSAGSASGSTSAAASVRATATAAAAGNHVLASKSSSSAVTVGSSSTFNNTLVAQDSHSIVPTSVANPSSTVSSLSASRIPVSLSTKRTAWRSHGGRQHFASTVIASAIGSGVNVPSSWTESPVLMASTTGSNAATPSSSTYSMEGPGGRKFACYEVDV